MSNSNQPSDDKLDMQSPDLVQQNIEKLAELFPNCVTESATGKAIDFDLLKQELNHAVVEGNKERYRLEWPGKREAIVTANLLTTKTLRPVREDSVDFDNTENIYIEGDNLEVLKLLQESYLGKIKMIYIDPPYNTGHDFVYKDNFSKQKEEDLFESGQKNELSQRLVVNPETSGRYHSDWLSMIYPRLKLARNLLKDEGVIFISIDDNEVHNLRKVCDDIFGENNFVSNIIWEKKFAPQNDAKWFSENHDHILCYAKNKELWTPFLLPRTDEANARYQNMDNDSRGLWTSDNLLRKDEQKSGVYTITTPNGTKYNPPSGRSWRVNESKFNELVADNRIWFGKDGGNVPRLKRFLDEVQDGIKAISIWKFSEVGHNQQASQELRKLFNGESYFDTPKPVSLIERIIDLSCKDGIILDFFAGSATSAHACISANAKDGGSRRFIAIQLPEAFSDDSIAKRDGFNTISDFSRTRIKKASVKIKEETGADIDYGFRVYRLDESNMQDVYYRPQDFDQANMDMFGDNVKPDRNEDDLLAQVMLDWGLPLSLKIEQANVAGKKVFKVADNSLFACFDKGIDEAFAKEIAKEKPLRIVFKDAGFKDDTAKTNVKQLLKQLSPETEMKVL